MSAEEKPKPKRKGNKEAKRDFDIRVRRIVRVLSLGGTRSSCLDYAMQQYEVSERTAIRMYEAALAEIRQEWSMERPDLVAQFLSTSAIIVSRSMATNDHTTAISAMQFQARLVKVL